MDGYLQKLVKTNPMREPLIESTIEWLGLPLGSRGLDAGCGIGRQAALLAEAIGAAGHVTGADISREFIDYAKQPARDTGYSDRTEFIRCDVNKLPFDGNVFDWAISQGGKVVQGAYTERALKAS